MQIWALTTCESVDIVPCLKVENSGLLWMNAVDFVQCLMVETSGLLWVDDRSGN